MPELLSVEIQSKTFTSKEGNTQVLQNMEFEISEGEFVSIIGQSGCGKSTLLRIIAGLEKEYVGTVKFKNQNTSLSFVFQDLGLFPWMSVSENLKFINQNPLQIEDALKNASLTEYRNSWIKDLSGGMRQRLAIARGLINEPKLLLLDEPMKALDMITKEKLQNEIKELLTKNKTTTILVTHDIEEAIFFSNRIIVVSEKPSSVKKVFAINVDTENRISADFQNLKAAIKTELF